MTPLHSFEIQGAGGGLLGMFGGKPQLNLFNNGIGWPEGKEKKFADFSKISGLKFSKYYSTVTIVHTSHGPSETKKVTLLNIGMFETIWSDFSKKNNITIRLQAE
ncbi:MAG: hypothetical protein LBI27_03940 [Clostridiales bacterium]|jgi:hypothetical protein|nr:hypothetical protein [Clostridiales bacterium]